MARTRASRTGDTSPSALGRLRGWIGDVRHRHVAAGRRPVGPGRDRVERYLATGAAEPTGVRAGAAPRRRRRTG